MSTNIGNCLVCGRGSALCACLSPKFATQDAAGYAAPDKDAPVESHSFTSAEEIEEYKKRFARPAPTPSPAPQWAKNVSVWNSFQPRMKKELRHMLNAWRSRAHVMRTMSRKDKNAATFYLAKEAAIRDCITDFENATHTKIVIKPKNKR